MSDDVKVKFGGDFSGLADGAASAGKIAGTALSASFKAYGDSIKASLANAFSVTNLMGKFFENIKHSFEYFREIDELSRQLDVSREDLQKFGKLGKEVGISMETMGRSIQFANKTIGAATISAGAQRDTLKALGYTEEEVTSGKVKAIDVMMKLAGEYDKNINSNIIAKHTTDMFGRSGGELTKILREGTEALRDRIDAMQVYSESEVRAGAAADRMYDKAVRTIQSPFKGAVAGWGQMFTETIAHAALETAKKKEFGTNFIGDAKNPQPEDVKPEQVDRIAQAMRKSALRAGLNPEDYYETLLQLSKDADLGGHDIAMKVYSRMNEIEEKKKEKKDLPETGMAASAVLASSSLQQIGGGDIASVFAGTYQEDMLDATKKAADSVTQLKDAVLAPGPASKKITPANK